MKKTFRSVALILLCGFWNFFAVKAEALTSANKNRGENPLEKDLTKVLDDMEVQFVRLQSPYYFVVNKGSRHGLQLGDLICAITGYTDSDSQNSSSASLPNDFEVCGTVVRLKAEVAAVAVGSNKISQVKVEHAARKVTLPPPPKAPLSLILGYRFVEHATFQYSLIKFNINAFINEQDPVWMTETTRSGGFNAAYVGFGIERPTLWPLGHVTITLSPIRIPEDRLEVDYSVADPSLYAKTNVSSLGAEADLKASFDFALYRNQIVFKPFLGLFFYQMRYLQEIAVHSDNEGKQRTILKHEAKWIGLGPEAGLANGIRVGQFTFDANWYVRMPLALSSLKQKATIDLPTGLPVSGQNDSELIKQVQLKPAKVGQVLGFDLSFAF